MLTTFQPDGVKDASLHNRRYIGIPIVLSRAGVAFVLQLLALLDVLTGNGSYRNRSEYREEKNERVFVACISLYLSSLSSRARLCLIY